MTDDHSGRTFSSVTPSPEDLARAAALDRRECPRRYCWWWRTLSFDWDQTPDEGCQYLEASKPSHWELTEFPCCRADSRSEVDQYEPREPHLEADGFHRYRFLSPERQPPGADSNSDSEREA